MKVVPLTVLENQKIAPLEKIGHKIQEIAMPIFALEGNEIKVLGTGFAISHDGIIVTAKHVISDYLPNDGSKKIATEIYCLYIKSKQDSKNNEILESVFLPLKTAWYSDQLDIAYCWLEMPHINNEPLKLSILGLSPGIPKIGEKITAFGYYKSTAKLNKKKFLVDYSQNTGVTHGVITEVYDQFRDSVLLPFPSFQTDALFKGGMSGGPVFNEKGSVCGIICSGDEDNVISYASLVWPSLAMPIEVNFKQGDPLQKVRIYELIKKGIIPADDTFARVSLDLTDSEIARIRFHH